jgi:ABC-type lipopolysaccharide export system ATPase subunit
VNELKGDKLLKFESVQNWLNSLNQIQKNQGKRLSKTAKAMRLGRMLEYTNNGELNPDEFLVEAKENIDKTGERLSKYFEEKQKKVSFNSAITSLCYLRGFYTHNNLTFPKKWGVPKKRVSQVSERDGKDPFFEYNAKSDEVEFKNGNMQHFIQNLNFRDQTIVLCLLSSGADATDLLNLKVGFVKNGRGKIVDKKRFFWHGNRAKTAQPFKTFFSEEATQFLKRYVEQERVEAKDDEPLFVGQKREYTFKKGKRKGEKVVVDERLTAQSLSSNFRDSAQKMGMLKKKNVSSPFRPKRFRHLFRTACAIAQIDNGFTMAFMGHASSVSNSYLEQDASIFEKMYVKIEPFLTVFGINQSVVNEMTREVSGLKAEVSTLSEGGKAIVDKVQNLEAQLKQATQMIYSFEPLLNTFNKIANTTEGQELIKKIHEAKLNQETVEAQNEANKHKAEITKENPIQNKVKRE